MTSGTGGLRPDQWAMIGRMADAVIPAFQQMPAAGEVGVTDGIRSDVMRVRPDLLPGLRRAADLGLALGDGASGDGLVEALVERDLEAFDALFRAVAGAYYASPRVRALLDYPGQVPRTYDVDETPEYVTNGWLDRVLARGPRYRTVPGSST